MQAEQLDLLSADSPAPYPLDTVQGRAKSYSLFFALVPEPECAQRLAVAADHLCQQHGLRGRRLEPGRLHMTLFTLEHGDGLVSQDLVEAACAAAARVKCEPLPLVFGELRTFEHSSAYVLCCDEDGNARVKHLRELMQTELRRFKLRSRETATPHMSLLYDEHKTGPYAVEPTPWTASRLALILSHVGVHHHQRIAEWVLA